MRWRARPPRHIALVVALSIVAACAAVAGCGGGAKTSPHPSASPSLDEKAAFKQYHRDLAAVDEGSQGLTRLMKEIESGEFSEPIVLAEALGSGAQHFGELTQQVAAVKPPPSLTAAHAKLVKACGLIESAFYDLQAAVEAAAHGVMPDEKALNAAVARAKRGIVLVGAWERSCKREAKRLGLKI